ncbi:MAG: hypothetical protein WDO56_05425 [Gammaproteobacteria bacterium]
MARAQALDPDCLFETRVIGFRCTLGERPLCEANLALGIASFGQSEAAHLDPLLQSFPDLERQSAFPGASGTNPEIPFIAFGRGFDQLRGCLIGSHAVAETTAGLEEQPEAVVVTAIVRIECDQTFAAGFNEFVALSTHHPRGREKSAKQL